MDTTTTVLQMETGRILEDEMHSYPYITLSENQPCNGAENSILYGELVLLVLAMLNRANQPKAKDKDGFERLYGMTEEGRLHHERQFPDEEQFPVLLLSYVGSQHGRLRACPDLKTLLNPWLKPLESKNVGSLKTLTNHVLWCLVSLL